MGHYCLHDGGLIVGDIHTYPIAYDDVIKKWTLSNKTFCSASCAKSYLREHHRHVSNDMIVLFSLYCYQEYGTVEVLSAPERGALKRYRRDDTGFTLEEFRDSPQPVQVSRVGIDKNVFIATDQEEINRLFIDRRSVNADEYSVSPVVEK